MSLVEKAIQKMQESKREASLAKDSVFGAVVSSGVYKTLPNVSAVPVPPVRDRIVVIDQNALRVAGLLPPEHQERKLSQQYRQIKRPLIANALGRGTEALPNGRLIMMASAVPGEGKTFTSLNLAFSMALEKDLRVLLVDTDIPKPHISKLLGLEQEPGLMDVLKDNRLDVETVILPTSVQGLSILPAGKGTEHATEMLASDRMREVASRLIGNDARRIVLFDSPPLLLTTESQTLSQVAGQVVLVVRAGFTSHHTVLDAVSYLDEDKPVFLILNQSTQTGSGGYYYYNYGESAGAGQGNG